MIDPRARVLLFCLGLAVLVLAINLVRKRQLQERYALLRLLAGLVLVLAPLFVNVLDQFAARLGFGYPPALLLMLAVVGLMLIIAQLSLAISGQAERIKVLTQELGLLRAEVAALKTPANDGAQASGQIADDESAIHFISPAKDESSPHTPQ